jgi:hypothetical protein
MLGMTLFARAGQIMGGTLGNVPQLTMCLDSERLCSKTAPAEFYRSACFALIMPSRRRGVARIFAYDRGTAPQVTPARLIAVMIRSRAARVENSWDCATPSQF